MEPDKNIHLYGVVSREGLIYRNREGRLYIYESAKSAQREAGADGDAVVHVTVHLDHEPLFIRRKRVRVHGSA